MNRRECYALYRDLTAGVRWWVDFGFGPEELALDIAGKRGLLLSWCPL